MDKTYTFVVARPWPRVGRWLVFSLLSLVAVPAVEAQTVRRIPISSCTQSAEINSLITSAFNYSLVCPVPDDDVFPKGDVTLMSLAWNSSDSNAILVVKACSDSFNGANINCTEVKRRTGGANRRVTFTKSDLAFAWGPGNEDAYAFIVIYFGGLLREGLIGGISLFRD